MKSKPNISRNLFYAIAVIGLVVLWFSVRTVSSLLVADKPEEQPKPAEIHLVGVRDMAAQPYRQVVRLRGSTQAEQSVTLRSDIRAEVIALPVRQGQRVKKGTVVCALESTAARAAVTQASSALKQAQLEHTGALRLAAKGIGSKLGTEASLARLNNAKALLAQARYGLEKTLIRAPNNGVIDRIYPKTGDLLRPDQECAVFVVPDIMLLIAHASETNVQLLQEGAPVEMELKNGIRLPGKISFVSSVGSLQSRTYRVEAQIPNPQGQVISGMVSTMYAYGKLTSAHYIKPSALTLDSLGRLGVRMVSPSAREREGTVLFIPVEIIGDDDQGIWITGAQDGLFIEVGADFVSRGDTVQYETVAPEGDTVSTLEGSAR